MLARCCWFWGVGSVEENPHASSEEMRTWARNEMFRIPGWVQTSETKPAFTLDSIEPGRVADAAFVWSVSLTLNSILHSSSPSSLAPQAELVASREVLPR
jgi:hypothetical protein